MNVFREQRVRCTIAIVGGGFSGSMLAVQLARRAGPEVSTVLIERSPVLGRGVAYGTKFKGHLLNVRAGNMSAYPDVPDHFVEWARRNYSPAIKPGDFLPRSLYGDYVASQLREAINSYPDKLQCIQGEVIALKHAGSLTEVLLSSGHTPIAGKVVFALGHFAPGGLPFLGKIGSSRYISNPWSADTAVDLRQDKNVLLIGSGLTSVDVVLQLRAHGFDGTVHILSRRGLLPLSHKATVPRPPFWNETPPRTVRGLLRLVRLEAKAAEEQGSDWRAVIDSLRPVTQKVWQTLPRREQRRFLRHIRPYWDVCRHRMAEQIASQLASLVRSGQIHMHAGRIERCHEIAGGVEITIGVVRAVSGQSCVWTALSIAPAPRPISAVSKVRSSPILWPKGWCGPTHTQWGWMCRTMAPCWMHTERLQTLFMPWGHCAKGLYGKPLQFPRFESR